MVAEQRVPNPFRKRQPEPLSLIDVVNREPPKMSLTNFVDPKDTIFPQFNPEEITAQFRAQWEKMVIPGLSHQRMNYISSSNVVFRFLLRYDATGRSAETRDEHEDNLRFIQAHFHPRLGGDSILGGEAPRILFIWPTLISLTAVIEEATFKFTRFNSALQLMAWNVSIGLSEIRDIRLTFEEVRATGMQRAGSLPSADVNVVTALDILSRTA